MVVNEGPGETLHIVLIITMPVDDTSSWWTHHQQYRRYRMLYCTVSWLFPTFFLYAADILIDRNNDIRWWRLRAPTGVKVNQTNQWLKWIGLKWMSPGLKEKKKKKTEHRLIGLILNMKNGSDANAMSFLINGKLASFFYFHIPFLVHFPRVDWR